MATMLKHAPARPAQRDGQLWLRATLALPPGLRSAARAAAVAVIAGAAFAAPAVLAAPPEPTADGGLRAAAPEQAGIDSRELVRLSEWIRNEKLDVHSLLVVKDGKLVFERYSGGVTRDHNYELYSVTKGVTALTAGMLIGQGAASLDEPVAAVLSQWRPDLAADFADKRSVELRHVLSMSSGLHYDFKPKDDPIYYTAPDRLKLAAATQPKEAPGARFEYTDINPILASAALSAAAGMPIERYAAQRLFAPMGMRNAVWDRADARGLVSAGWGLRLRPVDMAKIGMLVLDGGKWQGKQLVPKTWIAQMVSPTSAPDFGYYWWVNNIVRGEPEYDTMGFKGQFIVVLPQRHTVVVMTSLMSVDGGLRDAANVQTFRKMVNDYILPALDNKRHAKPSAASRTALRQELELAAQSRGVPGTSADPTDTPRLP
ncbi:6-aminohexanoate hydrolase [Pandoraea terrae]|uniref:6-aminohexanoate hydrolase n=1 Tax=Pandoraea terrae TaxID=1537710 RepID=A0A5E4X510_9BURK|nr:serine hydrolase [Pandoraea terrae]VVE31332.1 6-aminohexanoate hydrolase [Pandoraea terrae]